MWCSPTNLTPRVRHASGPSEWIATWVSDRVSIGANATILCGVRLGFNSMVGAGSVVVNDVADHALIVGNPATQRGWACDCGARLEDDLSCSGLRTDFRVFAVWTDRIGRELRRSVALVGVVGLLAAGVLVGSSPCIE